MSEFNEYCPLCGADSIEWGEGEGMWTVEDIEKLLKVLDTPEAAPMRELLITKLGGTP